MRNDGRSIRILEAALSHTSRAAASRRGLLLGAATTAMTLASVATVRAQSATPMAGEAMCPATSVDENIVIAHAYFDAFNNGDPEALDALLADDYVHAGALVSEQDRDIHLGRVLALRESFPNLHFELDEIIAEGNLVAVRHTFTGNQDGGFFGQPATGKPVAVAGIHLHRIACGKIAETWNEGDAYGLLQQVGLLPGGGEPVTLAQLAPAATPAGDCPPASPEENRAVAARFFGEAVNPRNLDAFDEFMLPDTPVLYSGLPGPDLEGTKALFADLYAGFSDLHFATTPGPARDDLVVERWTATGTHDGPFQGVEATCQAMEWSGISIYQIACGQIVTIWNEADRLGRSQQLGLVPDVIGPSMATPAR